MRSFCWERVRSGERWSERRRRPRLLRRRLGEAFEGRERSKRRWAAGKRAAGEKLEDREALAASFAAGTPAGKRLAQRDRERMRKLLFPHPLIWGGFG